MQKYLGYFLLILGGSCWGLTGFLGLSVKDQGVSALEVAFWRALIGGALFAAQAVLTNKWQAKTKDRLIFLAFGLPGVAILFGGYQVAAREVGMGMATILQYTATAWTVLWGVVLFKEPLTKWKIIAAAMAFGGATLICLSGGTVLLGITPLGVGIALFTGFCYSLHSPFSKKYMQKYSPITIYMHTMLMGAVFLFPFIDFADKDFNIWLQLVILSFITVWAGYWAYLEGVKRVEVSKVGVLSASEPLVSALVGFLIFSEVFTLWGWIGCVIVVCAVVMSIKK